VAVVCPSALAQSLDPVPLGNLFDDAKGTSLGAAIQSDVWRAGASPNSLGVSTVQSGGLGSYAQIAPGISFDMGGAGGADTLDYGALPANDAISSLNSVGLSCTGDILYGQSVFAPQDEGIGMWADQFVTFDLNEIRVAGGLDPAQVFQFNSFSGINDFASPGTTLNLVAILSNDQGVLGGWVNGQAVSVGQTADGFAFNGTLPASYGDDNRAGDFSFTVTGDAKYLTLASLSMGDGAGTDNAVFGGATLSAVPGPSTLALGGFGLLALRRRRR